MAKRCNENNCKKIAKYHNGKCKFHICRCHITNAYCGVHNKRPDVK